jgi:DNA-binding NarL/FixJ family response regulator
VTEGAITVAIVDDQALVRRGIATLLSLAPDIAVVAEAGDLEEALRLIRETRPRVILIDVRMPDGSGIELLEELRAAGLPGAPVMLTTFDDDRALFESLERGARGFLLKDTSLEELLAAVRAVAAGGSVPRPAVTARVRQGLEDIRAGARVGGAPAGGGAGSMTEREVEVLRLLAGGFSNREVGTALGVAEGTVKNHVSSILGKLGCRDRTRAVLRALDLGVI